MLLKKSVLNYVFGLIHVVFYGVVAFFLTIYGDFILNIFYYIPANIYGLIYWRKYVNKSNEEGIKIVAKKLSFKQYISMFASLAILVPSFGLFLGWIGDKAPFLDAALNT